MTIRQRLLIGALGGITPYIVSLLTIDLVIMLNKFELFDWIGLAVRCFVLVFLGALVAFLHKQEIDQFKVFQLGVAAPALLATFINGNSSTNQIRPVPIDPGLSSQFFVGDAYAGEVEFENAMYLKSPKISAASRFFRGFVGSNINNQDNGIWFVIVGSHASLEKAELHKEGLRNNNYESKIYQPYGKSGYYAVVIAANVSRSIAESVRARAIADGLPNDSYLWTY